MLIAVRAAIDEAGIAVARAIELLPNGTLKTYPGFSHGMLTLNADVLNADLLAFITG